MRTSRPANTHRPHARRWLGSVVVALFLAVLFAAPASAATAAEVAAALRDSPVYVAPDAPYQVDKNALLQKVKAADTPIFIAVLPESAMEETNGDPDALSRKIANEVDRPGSYLITAGTKYTAASSQLDRGEAKQLADQAFGEHGKDLDASTDELNDKLAKVFELNLRIKSSDPNGAERLELTDQIWTSRYSSSQGGQAWARGTR